MLNDQELDHIKLVLKELQIVITCPIAGTITQEFKNERMLELINELNERIGNGN